MKVVALGKSAHWSQGHGYGGLLGREIARQAFLIAARERFGLATRDYWLAEPMPEPGGALQFDIVGTGYEESILELLEGSDPQQESLRCGRPRRPMRGDSISSSSRQAASVWLAPTFQSYSRSERVAPRRP